MPDWLPWVLPVAVIVLAANTVLAIVIWRAFRRSEAEVRERVKRIRDSINAGPRQCSGPIVRDPDTQP